MNFLLLNQTFYPDVASSAQHLADVAAALTARGHQVTVLTGRRAYDDPRRRFAKRETWRGVRILRVGSTGFGKSTRWRRALDCASFFILCCGRVLLLPRHDVIIALTSPPFISLLGLCLARLRQSRFVYWVMDLNPDEAVVAGWLQAQSIPAWLLERISRLSLRCADTIIALDRFMLARIVAKGIPAARIPVLPPWSHDPEVRFDGAGRERFRKRHRLAGKFVVMYSGNHSPCHPLATVLEAARRLANHREIVFCFIGGGSEFRRIETMVKTSGLGGMANGSERACRNILCLGYQPLHQLSASLSAADLHLVTMGNGLVGLVHPCKIYNILRIGSPLVYIGPQPSPASEVIAEANGELFSASIQHGDVDGLVRHIEQVQNQSHDRSRPLAPALCSRFSKQTIVPRLIAQLEGKGPGP